MTRYPNLFLAGAPKCGTTSMAFYLGQHPDIFVPIVKEASYFGSDLTKNEPPPRLDRYLGLYKDWSSQRYALDASAQYFVSRSAAGEIFEVAPDAHIVIMVRNPVDAVYSQYFQNRFDGVEPIADFEAALAAEDERADRGLAPEWGSLERLLYSRIYDYESNISRYQAIFGNDKTTIILFDDFKNDTQKELIRLLNILLLDTSAFKAIELEARNTAKRARSRRLGRFAISPPSWAGRLASPFLSKSTRLRIRNMIAHFNTIPSTNPPMKPETRYRLAQKFTPGIDWLSNQLGRDLTHWLSTE